MVSVSPLCTKRSFTNLTFDLIQLVFPNSSCFDTCAAARTNASSEECCNLFFDSCAKRFHFSCCFGVSQTKVSIFLPVFANFNDGFSTSLTLLKKNVTFVKDLGFN